MATNNEYLALFDLRASDKVSISAILSVNQNDPPISSYDWDRSAEKYEAGADTLKTVGAGALLLGHPEAAAVAGAGAVLMDQAAKLAKQQAEQARKKEAAANERRALERQMSASVEKSMHEHSEKMSRGEYKDPPTRETAERMSHIA